MLDPTQLFMLVSAGVNNIFMWVLILILVRGQRAVTFPPVGPATPVTPPIVPDPGPLGPPDKPPVVPPIVPPVVPPIVHVGPRFNDIITTEFGGSGDPNNSAYDEHFITDTELGAALPYKFSVPPPLRIFANSKTVDVPTIDVGPMYPSKRGPADPYWQTGTRPRAESHINDPDSSTRTNGAGLDLTPATWKALGLTGVGKAKMSWDFVSVLDSTPGKTPATPTQPPVTGGTVLQHNTWPTQAECPSFYGSSEAQIRANLVAVHVPWLMNGKTQTIEIHKKCSASLERILNYIWEYCGKSQDKIHEFGYDIFDGSFNWRFIAGTSTPSVHSYGAAVDFNAAANPIRQAGKFKSDSLIVYAFTQEGWVWLGPTFDPMHFQASRVR